MIKWLFQNTSDIKKFILELAVLSKYDYGTLRFIEAMNSYLNRISTRYSGYHFNAVAIDCPKQHTIVIVILVASEAGKPLQSMITSIAKVMTQRAIYYNSSNKHIPGKTIKVRVESEQVGIHLLPRPLNNERTILLFSTCESRLKLNNHRFIKN
jgi:hypothetical protein